MQLKKEINKGKKKKKKFLENPLRMWSSVKLFVSAVTETIAILGLKIPTKKKNKGDTSSKRRKANLFGALEDVGLGFGAPKLGPPNQFLPGQAYGSTAVSGAVGSGIKNQVKVSGRMRRRGGRWRS